MNLSRLLRLFAVRVEGARRFSEGPQHFAPPPSTTYSVQQRTVGIDAYDATSSKGCSGRSRKKTPYHQVFVRRCVFTGLQNQDAENTGRCILYSSSDRTSEDDRMAPQHITFDIQKGKKKKEKRKKER